MKHRIRKALLHSYLFLPCHARTEQKRKYKIVEVEGYIGYIVRAIGCKQSSHCIKIHHYEAQIVDRE